MKYLKYLLILPVVFFLITGCGMIRPTETNVNKLIKDLTDVEKMSLQYNKNEDPKWKGEVCNASSICIVGEGKDIREVTEDLKLKFEK